MQDTQTTKGIFRCCNNLISYNNCFGPDVWWYRDFPVRCFPDALGATVFQDHPRRLIATQLCFNIINEALMIDAGMGRGSD